MMQEKDIEVILKKVAELKELFTSGQRIVPFLEDLFLFVQEMAPMLHEMNQSILDSTSKMPKAQQQPGKVTSATEMATHEILDKIDDLLARFDEISGIFSRISQRLTAEREVVSQVAAAVEALLKVPGARKTLGKFFEDEQVRVQGLKIKNIVDEFLAGGVEESAVEKVDQLIQATQSDAHDIMNSLQVQDITSQQIEGAHSMLDSIHLRLSELLQKYSDAAPANEFKRKEGTFDIQAADLDTEKRQDLADHLMEDLEEPSLVEEAPGPEMVSEPRAEVAGSQAEIDALFARDDELDTQAEELGAALSEVAEKNGKEEVEDIALPVSQAFVEEAESAAGQLPGEVMEELPEEVPELPEEAPELSEEIKDEAAEEIAGEVMEELPEEVPELPEEMPEVPEEMPEVPEEMPEVPEEMPEVPEEMPEVPEEMPELPEEVPELPEEVPELPEEIKDEAAGEIAGELPEEVPELSEEIKDEAAGEIAGEVAEELPEEVPELPEEVPELPEEIKDEAAGETAEEAEELKKPGGKGSRKKSKSKTDSDEISISQDEIDKLFQ